MLMTLFAFFGYEYFCRAFTILIRNVIDVCSNHA